MYVGICKIPPSLNPNQQVKVLSPKNWSVEGFLIETLKRLCHAYYATYLHLYQPLIAYSNGNLFSPPPMVSNLGSSSGFLVIGFGTKLKLYGVLFPVAGAVVAFKNSLSSAAFLMKASFVANVT